MIGWVGAHYVNGEEEKERYIGGVKVTQRFSSGEWKKELVRWDEKRRHGRKQHMVYGINLHYIRNAPVAEPEKTYKLLKGLKSRNKKSTRRKKRTEREGI